ESRPSQGQRQAMSARYLLLHPAAWSPAAVLDALAGAQVEARVINGPAALEVDGRPPVFLPDPSSRSVFPLDSQRAFVDAGGAIVALGREGELDVPEPFATELLAAFVRHPVGPRQLLIAVRSGLREAAARAETARALAQAEQRSQEIGELTRIGAATRTARDLKTLLELILTQARRSTQSDAGSLYLVEAADTGTPRLRFSLAQTFSKPEAPFVEFTIPMD